jgi:hypothetical protein
MLFSKITAEVGLTSAWIIIPVFIGPVIEVWGDDKIGVQGSVEVSWMYVQVEGKVLLKIAEKDSTMYYFGPSYYLLMGEIEETKQIGRQGIGITIGSKYKNTKLSVTLAFGSLCWFKIDFLKKILK